MPELQFAWDPTKEAKNRRKHHISFEEAETVFSDEDALLIDDPEHSEEARFVLIGLSARLRVLVVVHAYREAQGIIRLISARKANGQERALYNRRWRT